MRDCDVRRVLLDRLTAAGSNETGTLVLEELGVCNGTVRADLAVVNGLLKAYEIKSERDTLVRLTNQASIYNRVFDTVTLVLAEKHLLVATPMIPSWWGIEIAVPDGDQSVVLRKVREEELNSAVDPYSLVELLWREELVTLIGQMIGAKAFRSKTRKALGKVLADALSLVELKHVVRQTLKGRKAWKVASQQTSSGVKFPPSSTSSKFPVPVRWDAQPSI